MFLFLSAIESVESNPTVKSRYCACDIFNIQEDEMCIDQVTRPWSRQYISMTEKNGAYAFFV